MHREARRRHRHTHAASPRLHFALAALMLVAVTALAGCIEMPADDVPDWVPDWLMPEVETVETPTVTPEGEPVGWAGGLDTHGRRMPYGSHGHGNEILLMGRSVMQGLFDHWDWQGQNGFTRSGYAFYYGEIAGPPEIDDAAIEYIENVPDTTVVFFKLCFVDFWADGSSGESNLAENVSYAEAVTAAAVERDMTLVLTTALPETAANSDRSLVQLHNEYGDAVRRIAAEHENVHVFDIRRVLADQQGHLYRGFAVEPMDAHLNEVAYLELEEELLEFLDATFGPDE